MFFDELTGEDDDWFETWWFCYRPLKYRAPTEKAEQKLDESSFKDRGSHF